MTEQSHSVVGDGPAFVWGHGLTSCRAEEDRLGLFDWSDLAAHGRSVVRYGARGHGASGERRLPTSPSPKPSPPCRTAP